MTLPGMPIRIGDPGVFACGPADIAPWEREPAAPVREPANAGVDFAQQRARPHWLVLSGCLDCNPRTGRYCRNHDVNNWWLTEWGKGGKQKTRPAQPLDAGT